MTDSTFRQGFWRLADPKISLASFAGIFLGACLASFVLMAVGSGLGYLLSQAN